MPQINIEVDEATAAALDRAAAARSISRPMLVRLGFKEMLKAEAEGREWLNPSMQAPMIDPADLPVLLTELRQILVEADRTFRHNAKRDAALHKKIAAAEADELTRLAAAEAGIKQRLLVALNPFRESLGRLYDAVLEHPRLTQIDDSIRQLEATVRAPPPANHTYINGVPLPSRWWHWPAWAVPTVIAVLVVQTFVTRNLPTGIAVRVIDRLLPGDAAFHQLAAFRYGHDICAGSPPVPAPVQSCRATAKTAASRSPHGHRA